MKKVVLSIAFVAAMVLGSSVYAQTPVKKEAQKEQTSTVKKEAKCEKAAKGNCEAKKADNGAATATPKQDKKK
ncbi:MAG: hypothetical protein RR382_07010 [Tannerellaceae bacterium]